MKIKELLYKALSIILPLGVMVGGLCLTSCEETTEVDEYANWQERNEEFINTIAQTAEANADGRWMRILSFKLDSLDKDGNLVEHGVEDYVYCHVEYDSLGDVHPRYTDFVSVNYRGRLMPTNSQSEGRVFDESYKGEFNPEKSVPRNFYVDELIVGWSTALMQMTKGDVWRIYIPANLGYGAQKKGDIPAYSALVFHLNLADFKEM